MCFDLFMVITDYTDWFGHRGFKSLHHDLLRSHVSYGKGGCGRSTPLGIFYVCLSNFPLILCGVHACFANFRWAIGLFLYQSLDAIDGYIL